VCFIALAKPAAAQYLWVSPLNIYAEFSCNDGLFEWTCAYTAFYYQTTPTAMYIYAFTQIPSDWGEDYGEYAVVDTELSDNLGDLEGWIAIDDDTGTPGLAELYITWSPYVIPEDYNLYSLHCINACDDNSGDTILGWTCPEMSAAAPQITGVTPVFIGSSGGNITVSGNNLVDAFYLFNGLAGNQPAVGSPPGWTATFAGYDSSTGDVTLSYANIPVTAPRGQQSLSLTSVHFGASTGQILVGDHSPVITGISPKQWSASGNALSITVNGSFFGAKPSVTVSGDSFVSQPVNVGVNNGYTAVSFQITVDPNDPGNCASPPITVTVTSNGWDGSEDHRHVFPLERDGSAAGPGPPLQAAHFTSFSSFLHVM
jgi:hypothetical protein